MDKVQVAVRLEDMAGILQSALTYKGPYFLEINGIRTTVSREEFLNFHIDVTIEDLWELKELVERGDTP
ncbi:hypothetical protein ACE3MS_21415 [Paenibacillus dendritiformis]|uniref:hypothetical protein n=1 Tax=Paenibacillus dendritiformis TaxID=130049 RepID=UPI0025F1466A|nr:hypothetical protein [uncultured Paenibacillus sp.]MDU5143551.1 hypothetical protein [Paenibacillus dendritiformis]